MTTRADVSLEAEVGARERHVRTYARSMSTLCECTRRLRGIESSSLLAQRVCAELEDSFGFARALVSSVDGRRVTSTTSHDRLLDEAALPIALDDCLPERQCVDTRSAATTGDGGMNGTPYFSRLLVSPNYLVVPVVSASRVTELLHATHGTVDVIEPIHVEVVRAIAAAYSLLSERLTVTAQVEANHAEVIRTTAQMEERSGRLAAAWITLEPFDVDDQDRGLPASPLVDTLSAREREVFELVSSGARNGEIADQLGITVDTVKTHVKKILRKFGAINRSEAIALWQEELRNAGSPSAAQPLPAGMVTRRPSHVPSSTS